MSQSEGEIAYELSELESFNSPRTEKDNFINLLKARLNFYEKEISYKGSTENKYSYNDMVFARIELLEILIKQVRRI